MRALQVGEIWAELPIGEYTLTVTWGEATNQWPIWVVADEEMPKGVMLPGIGEGFTDWPPNTNLCPHPPTDGGPRTSDPILADRLPEDWQQRRGGIFLSGTDTLPMPFWRESGYQFEGISELEGRWERLFPIAGDCVLDPDFLERFDNYRVLLQRIDMRTYHEHPVLIEVQTEVGKLYLSTLRPHGGLGCQPTSLKWNPVGRHLVAHLLSRSGP